MLLSDTLLAAERSAIVTAVLAAKGDLRRAAVELGLSRRELDEKLVQHADMAHRLAAAVRLGWNVVDG